MSDWFKNDPSEIPDEMWRAATPMQRQADAVVLWAELTGKHASNCGNHGPAKPKKKATKTKVASAKAQEAILTAAKHPALVGAAIGAPVGALKEYLDNRSRPGSVSSREAKAVGALAAGKYRKLSDKKIQALEKRLAKAREEKKSVGKQVLKGAVVGAGAGAAFGAAHKAIRKKR